MHKCRYCQHVSYSDYDFKQHLRTYHSHSVAHHDDEDLLTKVATYAAVNVGMDLLSDLVSSAIDSSPSVPDPTPDTPSWEPGGGDFGGGGASSDF